MNFDVLLVDDNPADLYLTQRALARSQYALNCTVAKNGQQALALLNARSYGLVILDLNLPDTSGFDVLQQTQESPSGHKSPMMVLTTSCSTMDQQKVLELGAIGFESKPRSIAGYTRLVQVIDGYLG